MATQPRLLTAAEYLDIERRSEIRHEFLNGEMFAMAGGTFRHNKIVNNLASTMRGQIRGRCDYATTDVRLYIPSTGLYTYPDLMVICGGIDFADQLKDMVTNPILIAEVLSNSTADYDRGRKFEHYRSIPTLQEYVVIAQDRVHVEQYTRSDDGAWTLREYSSPGDTLKFASIDADASVSAIYEE